MKKYIILYNSDSLHIFIYNLNYSYLRLEIVRVYRTTLVATISIS